MISICDVGEDRFRFSGIRIIPFDVGAKLPYILHPREIEWI
jgi:hypothetical protein